MITFIHSLYTAYPIRGFSGGSLSQHLGVKVGHTLENCQFITGLTYSNKHSSTRTGILE